MTEETKKTLHRLKRWIGKERARCDRLEKAAFERGDREERSRAYGEANVLSMVMGKIDALVREKSNGDA